MSKRVALYYPWVHLRGGVERCILELVTRSRHEYTVYTSHVDYDGTFPEFRKVPRLVELRQVSVQRTFGRVLDAVRTIYGQRLALDDFAALMVHSEGVGDFLTLRNHDRPVICYCHSLQRPIYDPVYRETLLREKPWYRLPLASVSPLYRMATRAAWRRYEHVFVNSEDTRRHVMAAGLCPQDRIEVLHPGVSLERIRPRLRYEPFFLYAGRIKWTKNVELAVRAFLEFKRTYPRACEWKLVVAGDVNRHGRSYLSWLREISAGEASIEFRTQLSDAEMDGLYDRCSALLYPSLSENWGIVPLEAMAFGKPVLAVNRAGPTESIVDGVTGLLLEPSASAFAEAMASFADHPDLLRRMGAEARERAALYSWDRYVGRLDEYVERHC